MFTYLLDYQEIVTELSRNDEDDAIAAGGRNAIAPEILIISYIIFRSFCWL
jgi:hypothetical protein